jgi:hypothetical protein
MYILNTQARHLNNIAAHNICMSDHYKECLLMALSGLLKDETMFESMIILSSMDESMNAFVPR